MVTSADLSANDCGASLMFLTRRSPFARWAKNQNEVWRMFFVRRSFPRFKVTHLPNYPEPHVTVMALWSSMHPAWAESGFVRGTFGGIVSQTGPDVGSYFRFGKSQTRRDLVNLVTGSV